MTKNCKRRRIKKVRVKSEGKAKPSSEGESLVHSEGKAQPFSCGKDLEIIKRLGET